MGILSKKDLATFAVKCKRFYKVGGTPRQIKFEHNSHEDGNDTFKIITDAYSDVMFGTISGLSRKDWTFKTNTEEERDAMYEDLSRRVAEYNESLMNPNYDPSVSVGNGNDDDFSDTDFEPKKSTDWLTYIIVGVAAVAIIALLLWPRKKK